MAEEKPPEDTEVEMAGEPPCLPPVLFSYAEVHRASNYFIQRYMAELPLPHRLHSQLVMDFRTVLDTMTPYDPTKKA